VHLDLWKGDATWCGGMKHVINQYKALFYVPSFFEKSKDSAESK